MLDQFQCPLVVGYSIDNNFSFCNFHKFQNLYKIQAFLNKILQNEGLNE